MLQELVRWLISFILFNLKPILQIILIPGLGFVMLYALIAVWFERKYLAHAMLRIGPLYAGKVAGWLQLIADFLKLLTKELIIPEDADKTFFYLAPILLPVIPSLAVALIPFSSDWILFKAGGLGLPAFFAIMGLVPLFPLLAGWASNNKYTMIGSIRAAYLYISAEIPLIISAMGVAVLSGSFDLVKIVEAQSKVWFIIPQFVGFIAFFIGILAEAERTPFDIAVAEQEIVFGWRTEYTGVLFALTMMSEYVTLLAWILLLITLYLGGYHGPLIFGSLLASRIGWMLIKLGIVTASIILMRTVFPRFRVDQALRIGWCYLTPLAIINIFLTLMLKTWGVWP